MWSILLHSEDPPWAAEMPFLFLLIKTMNSTWVCVGCVEGNVQRNKNLYFDPSQQIQVLSYKLKMSPGLWKYQRKRSVKLFSFRRNRRPYANPLEHPVRLSYMLTRNRSFPYYIQKLEFV